MKKLIEIEFEILLKQKYFIIYDNNDFESKEQSALAIELSRNFGIVLRDFKKVSSKQASDILNWLHETDKLRTQPFFPRIFPIKNITERTLRDIVKKYQGTAETITCSSFVDLLLKKKNLNRLECEWLSFQDWRLEKILFEFLSNKIDGTKLSTVSREERRSFLSSLNTLIKTPYYYSKYSSKHKLNPLIINLWKKVRCVVHPFDYKNKFPEAALFFKKIGISEKQDPPKPKLKNILWKGWRDGKDFEYFEKYLDQPTLTIQDVITNIRDFERNPRISKYKNIYNRTFGKLIPDQYEEEIVSLVMLQLKNKLLNMTKPKEKRKVRIPSYFHEISISSLLKEKFNYFKIKIDDSLNFKLELYCTNCTNARFRVYRIDTEERVASSSRFSNTLRLRPDIFNSSFFITAYSYEGFNFENQEVRVILYNDNEKAPIKECVIKFKEKVKTLVLFLYQKENNTLTWLGEPLKQFYAGDVDFLKNWNRVLDVYSRTPILTIGELAETIYDYGEEELTIETLKNDIKL